MAYRKLDSNLPKILLSHLRDNADKDGYTIFSSSSFALDHGISHETTARLVRDLQEAGKLEYTRMGNKGLLVHMIPKKPDPRKCPKCGEIAHDEQSRFCYRCGSSLLSWDEQLKIKIDSLMPRIYREINDSKLSSELSEVMSILMKKVFKEEV